MAGYLVLARKYRSATFDELVGQEPIARTLTNAITSGRIAHAYLFTGTRGIGKTTMARILAKALNCLAADAPTTTPCNGCDACVAIARGDDVDVVEIDGASNRGIDEIRELRANAIFRPARSRFKVYYIDEVHMLTKEAFNALLKTLEEPPGHVKFIFSTTEVEKVPATILSRCQRFDFRNISTRAIADHLKTICKAEKVKADDDALFRIARAGAGSMRDALSLLDQLLAGGGKVSEAEVIRILGTPPDERMIAIARAVADGDAAAALNELSGVLEAGVGLANVVTALADVFRNLMLAATCGVDSGLIELPDAQRAAVGDLAGRFSTPALVHAMGVLSRAAFSIRGSSVARGLVEAAVVRLAAAEKFVDPASLIERLEALSAGGGAAGGLAAGPAAVRAPAQPARQRPASAPPLGAAQGETKSPPPPPQRVVQNLSTAEKQEIHNDPAVKEALTLFGGEVVDIRKEEGPPAPGAETQDKDNQ
ncbi:MAG TPA: DNA polymerase III subunit gamma/tau [Phycisphaerae bacterium]|nr:DNA polymerase III subunit gamma/tau [Phycisphaerae bacterium]